MLCETTFRSCKTFCKLLSLKLLLMLSHWGRELPARRAAALLCLLAEISTADTLPGAWSPYVLVCLCFGQWHRVINFPLDKNQWWAMQTLVQPFFQAMFWAALLDHTDSSTLLASCHANQKETPIGREKPPLKNRAHGAPDSACIVFLFCGSVVLQMVSPSPHLQILFLFCPNSLCTWLRAASHWMKAVLVRNLLKSFILKNKPFRVTPQSDGKVIFLSVYLYGQKVPHLVPTSSRAPVLPSSILLHQQGPAVSVQRWARCSAQLWYWCVCFVCSGLWFHLQWDCLTKITHVSFLQDSLPGQAGRDTASFCSRLLNPRNENLAHYTSTNKEVDLVLVWTAHSTGPHQSPSALEPALSVLREAQESCRKGDGCRQWVWCLGRGNLHPNNWQGLLSLCFFTALLPLCVFPVPSSAYFQRFILYPRALLPSGDSGGVWLFWLLPSHHDLVCSPDLSSSSWGSSLPSPFAALLKLECLEHPVPLGIIPILPRPSAGPLGELLPPAPDYICSELAFVEEI